MRALQRPIVAKATAAAGAVTVHGESVEITTEALTTAAQANYALTETNGFIERAETRVGTPRVRNGTNTQGTPVVSRVTVSAGQVIIIIKNDHASEALNGTLIISHDVENVLM